MPQIRTNSASAQLLSSQLLSGTQSYCSLKLQSISAQAPVKGSARHDGAISSALYRALRQWQQALSHSSQKATSIHSAISEADSQAASSFRGR